MVEVVHLVSVKYAYYGYTLHVHFDTFFFKLFKFSVNFTKSQHKVQKVVNINKFTLNLNKFYIKFTRTSLIYRC